jgi:hypothetical protein
MPSTTCTPTAQPPERLDLAAPAASIPRISSFIAPSPPVETVTSFSVAIFRFTGPLLTILSVR